MRLAAIKLGAGAKATVLLHGFLGSGKNLRSVAQKWSERDPERVFLLPDLLGHGESPAAAEDTNLRAMGRDVVETARAEGLEGPLELVGHSLGGRVALAASLVARDDVAGVALLDISPSPIHTGTSESGGVLEQILDAPDQVAERRELRDWMLGRGLSRPIVDWLMMNIVQPQAGGPYRWRIDRQGLKRLHARVNQEDLWEAVERPEADAARRIRALRGGRARYVSDQDVSRLEKAGVHVRTLDGVGHFVHVEALDQVVDFLASGQK